MTGKAKGRADGEGSIYQRKDGRWVAAVTFWEGSRRRRKSRYTESQSAARKALTALQKSLDAGAPMPSERLTVEDFLKTWLVGKEAVLRPEAYRKYKSNIERHITPELGRVPLVKLSAARIMAAYGAFRAKGLSGTSVGHIHGILHAALEDATRWDYVVRNVADLVDTPRRSTPEMRVLSKEEAESLLTAAKGDKLEALYVLALTTGLREGELLGLRWKDVDMARRRITVSATLQGAARGVPILTAPKTAKSKRQVAISQLAADALTQHRHEQLRQQHEIGDAWSDYGLVFCNGLGRPLDARNLRKRSFADLLNRAGIKAVRFHDLRHTAATLLMAAGVPVKAISEMLGHADIGVTLRVYSHVLPDMHEQAAATMDSLFGAEKATVQTP